MPESIAKKRRWQKAPAKLKELQERYADINLDDRSRTFNTELESALELGYMLDVAESMVQCALQRTESRGAHQRTDFPARDDERYLAHSLIYRNADGTLAGGVSAGDDYALATWRTCLRTTVAGARPGQAGRNEFAEWLTRSPSRSRATLRSGTSKPHYESYEVPVHKEWVVLDALNHIKDTVDGTLTYRWSCRMGICGSCGMMVNGEPKLTCATFLSSYAEQGQARFASSRCAISRWCATWSRS